LLHPEGVYDDPKGTNLREAIYKRLCYHLQFQNEFKLFDEIGNRNKYSINIYHSSPHEEIQFEHISNLFHPSTVDRCFSHDGLGDVPGIKDENGNWEIRGHHKRIITISRQSLELFVKVFDDSDVLPEHARLPSIHVQPLISILDVFTKQPTRLGDIENDFFFTPSTFWNETASQDKGILQRKTVFPSSTKEWILSGPHFYVATPIYQTPNENCRSHRDYSLIDLLKIPDDYLPRTNYIRACSPSEYEKRIPRWKNQPITMFYRHVNRGLLSQSGERTLINAIIPPGAAHINNPVVSITFSSKTLLQKGC